MTVGKQMKCVDERQFRSSSHREKVVEHVFLGELLRYLWVKKIAGVQVLKPEVDAAGYDLVLSLGKSIRHVQLKASMQDGRAQSQLVHEALGAHASGCVVWIMLREDLTFDHFRWFGGDPGKPLPDLTKFRRAKHNRANSQGVKALREHTWRVRKSAFDCLANLDELVQRLFGIRAV